MRTIRLLSLAVLASGLTAQANTVIGLDGRLTNVNNLTFYGRRGPAYPNGEVGMAMLNTMCNPGSVNIPWYAAMQPNHPFFGFMVVRVANDKIEQINEWSYCKHAWLSVNVNGACGTCQNPGTGALMGLNCADTYGAGNNANRHDLAPPSEIDPWLGTWNPVGSYFDIGDPMQPGFPAPADGIRSLNDGIFDSVQNRVTVDEADLVTPNAEYYYGLQLVIGTEGVANRDDNLAHRGFAPSWSGSQWSFSNTATQEYGSILTRWPGAQIDIGQNGNDDGRFFVASKVTALGGGNYHYEYAIHNVDNSRAGGTFRLPINAGATATNFTFGDIDTDASNDWTAARVGNEIVFTSTASNPLEWNTIYNFGFDVDFPPGTGLSKIDEARVGPGALWVEVSTQVPGGATLALFDTFGNGCPGSVTAPPPPCVELNGTGGTLSNDTNQYEYCYRVPSIGTAQIVSFEIFTASNSGTLNRPAHIYAQSGNGPAATPLASTTITVGTTPGFYTATFATPVNVTGTFYVGYENSPNGVISNLTAGTPGVGHYRTAVTGNWSQSGLVDFPSYRVNCTGAPVPVTPKLANGGLPNLGSSYDLTLADALANTFAVLVSGLSDNVFSGGSLPVALPGAAGCDLLVAPEALELAITTATGTATSSITVPNTASLVGLEAFHQWAVFDPSVNALGIVMSNAGRALVGN